jgi:Icc-related predicted phosphoesterase
MKIAMISDTHGLLPPPASFEGADLILHAGDIGPDRGVEQWIHQTFRPWLHQLRENMEIPFWATFGNHDDPLKWGLESADLPILVDDDLLFRGLKIWFSPWSVRFGDWHWMTDESRLTDKYAQIPVDSDIVVSHTPMFKVRDANVGGNWCGSKALRVRVRELHAQHLPSRNPIVVCGHIHEARGYEATEFAHTYNVASLDEFYQMREEPITWVEL